MDGHGLATITLPSLIGPARRQLAGAIRRVETVGFGDRPWWIGQDAPISRDSRTALNQDRVRDPVFISVLVTGALERMDVLAGACRWVAVLRQFVLGQSAACRSATRRSHQAHASATVVKL